MLELPPVPERMRGLPVFRGLPVPYMTFVGPDGTPDFKVTDTLKRSHCMQHNLCGLCGQVLGGVVVFIGGPECIKKRLYFDPGMHEECALYATQACPYLRDAEWDYSKAQPKHLGQDGTVVNVDTGMNPHRPDRLAVVWCRSYDMVRHLNTWYIKSGKPFKIDWNLCGRRDRREGKANAET